MKTTFTTDHKQQSDGMPAEKMPSMHSLCTTTVVIFSDYSNFVPAEYSAFWRWCA